MLCVRYHNEVKLINSIVDKQPLGILYIELEDFKTSALPQPVRLIEVIEVTLPKYVFLF